MSEYLQPNDTGLSISQKQDMFVVVNRVQEKYEGLMWTFVSSARFTIACYKGGKT